MVLLSAKQREEVIELLQRVTMYSRKFDEAQEEAVIARDNLRGSFHAVLEYIEALEPRTPGVHDVEQFYPEDDCVL